MIGKISGKINEIYDTSIIVDVGGVGYLVACSMPLIQKSKVNDNISLHIQTIVREDDIALYGFENPLDKKIFNLLVSVQRIGAKLAITALGTLSANEISMAIQNHDIITLSQISGISKKSAERIIHELKSKITTLLPELSNEQTSLIKATNSSNGLKNELESALLNLGFRRKQALMVSDKTIKENQGEKDFESLFKLCL